MLFVLLILAVATVAVATWRGRNVERIADARGQMVNGLHVESYGPEGAPSVVLIHGASGSTYDMTFSLAPKLAQDFRVYVVDRPGFGHSVPLAREGLTAQATAIRAAIAQIDPRPPIVLGQSYGGAVALAWAVDAPDSLAALVLVSAPSHTWKGRPAWLYRLLAMPVIGGVLAWMIAAWVPPSHIDSEIEDVFAPQPTPKGYGAYFQPEMALRPATHMLNARQRVALKSQLESMVDAYPALQMPIESLHGEADKIVPIALHAQPLEAEITSNHLTTLTGIGHMPHHVATGAVVQAVMRAAKRAKLM
ncbi:alpha/beta fold hydrolase [Celeribacter sp.]|uniref:alpha/beta fold hydrolase n=1 Tax=Celeribacter sp. TaxID=1890673 RepID=UPI003A959866